MSFLILPQHEQFYPEGLSVLVPFSMEFYLKYKVSIEIQSLSSTDCNFQGLSRRFSRFVQTLTLYHMQVTIVLSMASLQRCSTPNKINSYKFSKQSVC